MPLSEDERRRLAKLEQDLAAADPELNLELQSGHPRSMASRSVYGVLAVLAGFALVITGIATRVTVMGVIGFVLMGAGAYWFLGSVHWQGGRHHPS